MSTEDDDPAADWAEAKATIADGGITPLPEAVPLEVNTPRPDTDAHRVSQVEFATAVELVDRDAYARGVAHGRAAAKAEAEEAAMTLLRGVREDGVEAFRSFYVIWSGKWPATWAEAEAWYRRHLTPL